VTLHHDSPVPLYVQIKDLLQTQIETGAYVIGQRLPSERELAQRFNVSRMTARQALQSLAQEGLTSSRVGKGTFVSPPRINQELRTLTSFSEDMRERGMAPNSRVVRAEVVQADREIAGRLHIPPKSEIVLLSRVRLADDQPLALETTHIPTAQFPGLLNHHDFSRESLYDVLQAGYGCHLVWADQMIQACMPSEAEREALNLDARTPVLRLARVTYNQYDQPVEFVRSVYRGDQYQLRAVLRHSSR
jgi:GntR family transcriptional regulator